MLLVCSIMLNILGESSGLEGKQAAEDLMSRALQVRLVLLITKCMYHLRMCVLHVAWQAHSGGEFGHSQKTKEACIV